MCYVKLFKSIGHSDELFGDMRWKISMYTFCDNIVFSIPKATVQMKDKFVYLEGTVCFS